MKTFEYKGFDAAGKSRRGLIEATSLKEAREKLARDGVLAERISVTGRRLRFSPEKRATFYRELSALLGAGLPLVKALDNLIQSPDIDEVRVLLAGVRDSVKEGASLAKALSGASDSVTPFERAIVEVAERTATVEKMLDRLADFIEEQEKLRERIQGALIYPSIVLTVGVCVAILMLGLLLPRASEILSGNSIPLPKLTAFMIGFGRFAMKWGIAILFLVVFFALGARRKFANDPEYRRMWNRRLFALPIVGRGYTILVNLRFSRTMAILVHGGVSLIEGMTLAGRATGSSWISGLVETESESVRHGSSLSDAIRRIPPLSSTLPGWIQTGEASGELERLLECAGKRYQDQWDRFISRCLSYIEPILILAIGLFVLLVTLSVLLPVLSLSQAVSR